MAAACRTDAVFAPSDMRFLHETISVTGADADFNSNSEDDADDEESDGDRVPISMTEALGSAELDINLPPHQRCAAHIVNLLGTQDVKVALETNANFRKMHEATTVKIKEWWRRQNRSDLVASAIQDGLGVKLQVPGDTRWNSEYDARNQVSILNAFHTVKSHLLPKFEFLTAL